MLCVVQAEIQMHHKEEEVAQLQDSLAKIINEAGVRTRQEVCLNTLMIVPMMNISNVPNLTYKALST